MSKIIRVQHFFFISTAITNLPTSELEKYCSHTQNLLKNTEYCLITQYVQCLLNLQALFCNGNVANTLLNIRSKDYPHYKCLDVYS